MTMRTRKEKLLWNVLLGSGVYLLDSLRNRIAEGSEDIGERIRDSYSEASRRVGRASEAIRGEDHGGFSKAGVLLVGLGVGVGIGMLLAPASGQETRSTISNKVQEFGGRMKDKMQNSESSSTGTYGS